MSICELVMPVTIIDGLISYISGPICLYHEKSIKMLKNISVLALSLTSHNSMVTLWFNNSDV